MAATRGKTPCGRPFSSDRAPSASSFEKDLEGPVTTGRIKKIVADRGFGFISADDAKEYFFHRDGLASSLDFARLVGGERVVFDIEASPRGPRATNVRAE
jgi:CspA family cold shock protein